MRVKLYVGLKREGKWFRYAEVDKIKGGGLAALDTPDSTGAAKILNLVKGCVHKLYNEADEEYILKETDYTDIKIHDTWPISRAAIKLMNNDDKLVFAEHFYCSTCSTPGRERYTEVNEDWEELIEQGFVDERYIEGEEESEFWVELPIGIEVAPTRNLPGGTFNRIKRDHITLGDSIKLQKNAVAMENEASMRNT